MKHALTLGAAAVALLLGAATTQAQQTQPADSAVAAAAAAPADSAQANGRRPRRNPRELTPEEIDEAHVRTAYDAVARLRSRWLINRGGNPDADGSVAVQVYVNGSNTGGVETLQRISANDVARMQWLDPMASRSRYGPGNGRGAIVVTLKTGGGN